MRFSGYGLGASYLATHNHSAIPNLMGVPEIKTNKQTNRG
jgi:hypothetical protein